MGTVSVSLPSDGQTADAADYNVPINTIVAAINGNLDSNNILAGGVVPNSLTSGTGTSWAWQTWSPTWTNLTVGNGTTGYAKYIQIGKTVHFRLKFTFGSTTAAGSYFQFSAPVSLSSDYGTTDPLNAIATAYDLSATTSYLCTLQVVSSTVIGIRSLHTDGTRGNLEPTSGSDPISANFANGDVLHIAGTYEAA